MAFKKGYSKKRDHDEVSEDTWMNKKTNVWIMKKMMFYVQLLITLDIVEKKNYRSWNEKQFDINIVGLEKFQ